MKTIRKKHNATASSTAKTVYDRIEAGGERLWRFTDFEDMPVTAVAQALSRLYRLGTIQRLGKGLYYKPRQTAFGPSKPNLSQLRALPIIGKGIFPSGCAAANLLGFSTQHPARLEVATNGLSLPRLIVGKETIVHTRRPDSWQELSHEDAAILDFLRGRGSLSELSLKETAGKLLRLFKEGKRFERLFEIAISEPPRVRAILGAIGQELGYSKRKLLELRDSLNPLTKFDFGNLIGLKYAKRWQAREQKSETL